MRSRLLFCALASCLGGCQSLALDITAGAPDGSILSDAHARFDGDARAHGEASPTTETGTRDTGATCTPRDAACGDATAPFFCSANTSQASFPLQLTGTSNPRFTSGVATRNANRAFLFSGLAATDAGSACAIYAQAFDLAADGGALGAAASLYAPSPPNAAGLFVHDVATAPSGVILLVYGFGGGPAKRPELTNEGPLYALFLRAVPGAGGGGSGVAGLSVVGSVVLDSATNLYGQAHALWDDTAGVFHVSWERPTGSFDDAGIYSVRVQTLAPDGGIVAGEGYAQVPVASDGAHILNAGTEQGSVGVTGGVLGVAYVDLNAVSPEVALLAGSGLSDTLVGVGDAGDPPFVTIAGTPSGLVYVRYIYNGQTLVTELVTIQDGGATRVGAGTSTGGPSDIFRARAVGDNAGGGVGVALLHSADVAFAYVSPNAQLLLMADTSLPRYSDGGPLDELGVGSFGGSFIFSVYSNAQHRVTAAVSGCTPP